MLNTNTQGQEDRVTGQVTKKSTQRNEEKKLDYKDHILTQPETTLNL